MSRWGRKEKPPKGFEILEPTLNALENELRESKCTRSYDHFIFFVIITVVTCSGGFWVVTKLCICVYVTLLAEVNEPHEGKRKCESLWPVHQINWQRR